MYIPIYVKKAIFLFLVISCQTKFYDFSFSFAITLSTLDEFTMNIELLMKKMK